MEESIFEKGCLVQLTMSKWGGYKQIKKNTLDQMITNGNTHWVSARKNLVEPGSMKPINRITNAARGWLNSRSLPFPIPRMAFVPKESIDYVDAKLQQFQTDFYNAVNDFAYEYDQYLRLDAQEYLGDLFQEVDYPIDIKSRFRFDWRFLTLNVPNGNTKLLAPEVYAREKEKFIQTMEDARNMAVNALREEFAGMVEHLTERFSPNGGTKPKIFKNSTVDNFYEFFQTFKERNIFADDQLTELVTRAQSVLEGVSTDEIRNDEDLKRTIRMGMADIESTIAQTFQRPRRAVILD